MNNITKTLGNISYIMGDANKFLKIRFTCEKWEKEAAEGNKDSAALITLVEQFERLLKAVIDIDTSTTPTLKG